MCLQGQNEQNQMVGMMWVGVCVFTQLNDPDE